MAKRGQPGSPARRVPPVAETPDEEQIRSARRAVAQHRRCRWPDRSVCGLCAHRWQVGDTHTGKPSIGCFARRRALEILDAAGQLDEDGHPLRSSGGTTERVGRPDQTPEGTSATTEKEKAVSPTGKREYLVRLPGAVGQKDAGEVRATADPGVGTVTYQLPDGSGATLDAVTGRALYLVLYDAVFGACRAGGPRLRVEQVERAANGWRTDPDTEEDGDDDH